MNCDGDGEEELQRIDVEQDGEEQSAVEDDGRGVVQVIAAEVAVVRPPHHDEENETDEEGEEAEKSSWSSA